jgi:hypothetical protein
MPKIRLMAATLIWSAVTIGAATLAFVEGVQSKPDRVTEAAREPKDRPHDNASAGKDDTGAPYRRRMEAFDNADTRQPISALPTVWRDPPRR